MIKKISLLLALSVFGVMSASAGILDIRGGIGRSSADIDDFDEQAQAANGDGLDANDFETYHADIFINLPKLPFGFGIRHEWLNLNQGSGGSDLDLEATNLSLLVDWRMIDSDRWYLGPIVSIGHPSAKVDFNSGAVSVDDDIDGDEVSYAAALETGVYFGIFLVGAEAGYQNIEIDTTNNQGNNASFSATGFYGKLMAGLSFF